MTCRVGAQNELARVRQTSTATNAIFNTMRMEVHDNGNNVMHARASRIVQTCVCVFRISRGVSEKESDDDEVTYYYYCAAIAFCVCRAYTR